MDGVTFHYLAEQELKEAARFYESESAGLGIAFVDEIERSVRAILEFPQASPILRGSVRKRLARGFPYGVLYRTTDHGVRILAIMNLNRRPLYWRGRS